jgi:hypothetical protein
MILSLEVLAEAGLRERVFRFHEAYLFILEYEG